MDDTKTIQSPDYAKMSHATAISLGLARGKMYRGAVNRCVNLLLHYEEGCSANCAYCGLAKKRPGIYSEKSFINVGWPVYPMEDIISAVNNAPDYVQRICISMITNRKGLEATLDMSRQLRTRTALPVSVLISPTITDGDFLVELEQAGVDRIGVALDLATRSLFEKYRGKDVSGPHKWERYWESIREGLEIFGKRNVGVHLIVGMGETEKEMASLMERLFNLGVENHLFSFFPEKESELHDRPQTPWPSYLRLQMARYLIENRLSGFNEMWFNKNGEIIDFGLGRKTLDELILKGEAFMTTGCCGSDGNVACNRPFGNCLPGIRQWNYPYKPNKEELHLIQQSIFST